MTRPNSSHTGKRRRNRARGADQAPALSPEMREQAEAAIGHRFKNGDLLDRALTHRSAAQGKAAAWSNERLEFLGDRVLGLVIAETLLQRFPTAREGEIAPRLNRMVSRETCALVGGELGLGAFIIADASERQNGAGVKPSLLSNAMEAVIGAIHMDGGMTAARKFVLNVWKAQLQSVEQAPQDPKSALQEWAQGQGRPTPRYEDGGRTGPDHAPVFTARVRIDGYEAASGTGASKQEAERAAAKAMLATLKEVMKDGSR